MISQHVTAGVIHKSSELVPSRYYFLLATSDSLRNKYFVDLSYGKIDRARNLNLALLISMF